MNVVESLRQIGRTGEEYALHRARLIDPLNLRPREQCGGTPAIKGHDPRGVFRHAFCAPVGEYGEFVRSTRVESSAQAHFTRTLQVMDRAAQEGFTLLAALLTGELRGFEAAGTPD